MSHASRIFSLSPTKSQVSNYLTKTRISNLGSLAYLAKEPYLKEPDHASLHRVGERVLFSNFFAFCHLFTIQQKGPQHNLVVINHLARWSFPTPFTWWASCYTLLHCEPPGEIPVTHGATPVTLPWSLARHCTLFSRISKMFLLKLGPHLCF